METFDPFFQDLESFDTAIRTNAIKKFIGNLLQLAKSNFKHDYPQHQLDLKKYMIVRCIRALGSRKGALRAGCAHTLSIMLGLLDPNTREPIYPVEDYLTLVKEKLVHARQAYGKREKMDHMYGEIYAYFALFHSKKPISSGHLKPIVHALIRYSNNSREAGSAPIECLKLALKSVDPNQRATIVSLFPKFKQMIPETAQSCALSLCRFQTSDLALSPVMMRKFLPVFEDAFNSFPLHHSVVDLTLNAIFKSDIVSLVDFEDDIDANNKIFNLLQKCKSLYFKKTTIDSNILKGFSMSVLSKLLKKPAEESVLGNRKHLELSMFVLQILQRMLTVFVIDKVSFVDFQSIFTKDIIGLIQRGFTGRSSNSKIADYTQALYSESFAFLLFIFNIIKVRMSSNIQDGFSKQLWEWLFSTFPPQILFHQNQTFLGQLSFNEYAALVNIDIKNLEDSQYDLYFSPSFIHKTLEVIIRLLPKNPPSFKHPYALPLYNCLSLFNQEYDVKSFFAMQQVSVYSILIFQYRQYVSADLETTDSDSDSESDQDTQEEKTVKFESSDESSDESDDSEAESSDSDDDQESIKAAKSPKSPKSPMQLDEDGENDVENDVENDINDINDDPFLELINIIHLLWKNMWNMNFENFMFTPQLRSTISVFTDILTGMYTDQNSMLRQLIQACFQSFAPFLSGSDFSIVLNIATDPSQVEIQLDQKDLFQNPPEGVSAEEHAMSMLIKLPQIEKKQKKQIKTIQNHIKHAFLGLCKNILNSSTLQHKSIQYFSFDQLDCLGEFFIETKQRKTKKTNNTNNTKNTKNQGQDGTDDPQKDLSTVSSTSPDTLSPLFLIRHLELKNSYAKVFSTLSSHFKTIHKQVVSQPSIKKRKKKFQSLILGGDLNNTNASQHFSAFFAFAHYLLNIKSFYASLDLTQARARLQYIKSGIYLFLAWSSTLPQTDSDLISVKKSLTCKNHFLRGKTSIEDFVISSAVFTPIFDHTKNRQFGTNHLNLTMIVSALRDIMYLHHQDCMSILIKRETPYGSYSQYVEFVASLYESFKQFSPEKAFQIYKLFCEKLEKQFQLLFPVKSVESSLSDAPLVNPNSGKSLSASVNRVARIKRIISVLLLGVKKNLLFREYGKVLAKYPKQLKNLSPQEKTKKIEQYQLNQEFVLFANSCRYIKTVVSMADQPRYAFAKSPKIDILIKNKQLDGYIDIANALGL